MALTHPTLTYKAWAYKNSYNPIRQVEETIKLVKNPTGEGYIAPHGKILVKIFYASLNPVDYKTYESKPAILGLINSKQGFGCDFSGQVISVGQDTKTNVKAGDFVEGLYAPWFDKGSCAEYLLVDPKNSPITTKPESLDFIEASSFPLVLGTAMQMCSRGGIQLANSKVLVLGAGTSVGRYVTQLARNGHAKEVVTTNSSRTSELIQSLGSTSQIDYRRHPNLLQPVLESVKATGQFDYIIDCWGGADLFPEINTILRKGGVYNSICGDSPYTSGLDALLGLFKSLARTAASKLGLLNYTYEVMLLDFNAGWIDDARDMLADGKVQPFIDSVHPFDQLHEAIEKLESGTAQGKVVLEVSKDSIIPSSGAASTTTSNRNPFR
ncbi:hypothetical protein I9W82_004823 [Candida metapsilosis]|uniref:Enoyl reductase (ER) domain-containing protein n=1 Tax=Candida metapsilosis TaxID=273372 RepID=A0A8H7Z8J9_9ASCO|nr:hypothetical protein I9W82_004823 [Candida metapsilosis]